MYQHELIGVAKPFLSRIQDSKNSEFKSRERYLMFLLIFDPVSIHEIKNSFDLTSIK